MLCGHELSTPSICCSMKEVESGGMVGAHLGKWKPMRVKCLTSLLLDRPCGMAPATSIAHSCPFSAPFAFLISQIALYSFLWSCSLSPSHSPIRSSLNMKMIFPLGFSWCRTRIQTSGHIQKQLYPYFPPCHSAPKTVSSGICEPEESPLMASRKQTLRPSLIEFD